MDYRPGLAETVAPMRATISVGVLLPLQVGLTLILFIPALLLLTLLRAVNPDWAAAAYREMALTNEQFTRYRLRLAGEFVWDDPETQSGHSEAQGEPARDPARSRLSAEVTPS